MCDPSRECDRAAWHRAYESGCPPRHPCYVTAQRPPPRARMRANGAKGPPRSCRTGEGGGGRHAGIEETGASGEGGEESEMSEMMESRIALIEESHRALEASRHDGSSASRGYFHVAP